VYDVAVLSGHIREITEVLDFERIFEDFNVPE